MSVSIPEIEALTAYCRKHGIRRLKTADLEIEFGPDSEPLDVKRAKVLTDQFMAGQPTDEDMLFWSTWQPVKPGGEAADGEA